MVISDTGEESRKNIYNIYIYYWPLTTRFSPVLAIHFFLEFCFVFCFWLTSSSVCSHKTFLRIPLVNLKVQKIKEA